MSIKIQFEIGHTAMLKSKKTIDNFTHDWELYVKGIDKADISAFIDKIIFNLHESFPKPKRTVKDPPYILKESGYAGFIIPIDIYFKNRQMQKFTYDLELQQNGPPVHKSEIMKYIFESPSDDFRQKLIKGGGIYINNDEKNRDSSDEYKQLLNKPKFSSGESSAGSSSKKHKIRQDKNKEPTFANLFGTPIQKQPLPAPAATITNTNNSGNILGNTGSNSNSNSKVSPDPKSKSSPIVVSTSLIGTLISNKSNSSSSSGKIDKGYNSGQISTSNLVQQSSLSTGGSTSNINNKDKNEKSDKKDKQNKHSSPHKDKNNSSSNNKDSKKEDKHDRRNDRKKDKSHSKERDRSREKNSKQARPPSPPQLKQQQQKRIASPLLLKKTSPLRNLNKEDGHNSNKNKSNSGGNGSSVDLDSRKAESKKSKKDKKSHDKEKVRDRRDKERISSSTNDIHKISHHMTTKLTNSSSNNRMDSTGANTITQINNDTNKLDYNKSKDAGSISKNQSIKKSDSNKIPTDSYQQTSTTTNSEKKHSENLDKDEKRHKHKKKDKTKDKEKLSSRLNKDDSTKKNKDIENVNAASSSKNLKYSINNLQIVQGNNDTGTNITNNTINNNAPTSLLPQSTEPELSESESIVNSDIEVQTTETIPIKQKKITNHSDSSTNSYKDLVQQSRLKSLQSQQLPGVITPTPTIIPNTNNNNNKKERKSKENKKIEKEDKKRKRKSREETDLIIAAKKPNSPIATSSNSSADQQQSSIPKYMKKTDIKSGSGVSEIDSIASYSSTIQQQQDSFRTPTNNISSASSHSNNLNSNNNLHNRSSGIGGNGNNGTIDYMSELRDLQKKIMTLQDSTELQQVVEMIAATGRYEVTSKTFDFDLCALDRNTVQRLQDFFAATSVS